VRQPSAALDRARPHRKRQSTAALHDAVAPQTAHMILSRPANATGFTLQSTPNLTPPVTWLDVTNPPAVKPVQALIPKPAWRKWWSVVSASRNFSSRIRMKLVQSVKEKSLSR